MMDNTRIAHNLLKITAEIAGRLAADDMVPGYAAKRAKETVAALLGLESISFELEKDSRDEVSGVIVSYELTRPVL